MSVIFGPQISLRHQITYIATCIQPYTFLNYWLRVKQMRQNYIYILSISYDIFVVSMMHLVTHSLTQETRWIHPNPWNPKCKVQRALLYADYWRHTQPCRWRTRIFLYYGVGFRMSHKSDVWKEIHFFYDYGLGRKYCILLASTMNIV